MAKAQAVKATQAVVLNLGGDVIHELGHDAGLHARDVLASFCATQRGNRHPEHAAELLFYNFTNKKNVFFERSPICRHPELIGSAAGDAVPRDRTKP